MYRFYRWASGLAEKLLAGRYPERFVPSGLTPVDLWMHAASVGESRVAAAILKALRKIRPETKIFLSLQTAAGLAEARKLLEGFSGIKVGLAPWDGPKALKAFFETLRPRVLALVETELWPNLLAEARARNVPVVIVNGRLSDRSYPRYRRLKGLWRPFLTGVAFLGAISERDRARFEALGVPRERTAVLGNAKHDLAFERAGNLDPGPLARRLGLEPGQRLLVFGSLRAGEEHLVAELVAGLSGEPGVRFVVVPRHPERAPDFYRHLAPLGWPVAFFRGAEGLAGFRIVIVDEVGPLFGLYALASAALVGGSFASHGGQNPVEPAVFGKPILFGPHMENFRPEAESLLEAGGAVQVNSGAEALSVLRTWLRDPDQAQKVGQKALQAALKLRGASRRYARVLARFL